LIPLLLKNNELHQVISNCSVGVAGIVPEQGFILLRMYEYGARLFLEKIYGSYLSGSH
jgi:hypothetical protein